MHPKKYQKHDRAAQPASYVWKSGKMRIYKIWEGQILLFLIGWLVGWGGGVVCFFLKIMTKKDDDSTFSRSWFVLSQRVDYGSALGVESISQQWGWRRQRKGLSCRKLLLCNLCYFFSPLPPKGGLNTHHKKIL